MGEVAANQPERVSAVEQYRALLEISESIATHRDLPALFHAIAQRLHRLVTFDFIGLTLPDADRTTVRLHVLESSLPTEVKEGFEFPIEEATQEIVWEQQKALVVTDLEFETRFPRNVELLRKEGIRSFCLLPLTTAQRRVGALAFGSVKKEAYYGADLEFLQQVAAQVAVAVDNALNFQDAQVYQEQLSRERDRLRLLLELNNALVSNLDLRELLKEIAACLRRVIRHDYTALALYDPATNEMRLRALDFPEGKGLIQEEMAIPLEGSAGGEVFTTRKPLLVDAANTNRYQSPISRLAVAEGLKCFCILPLFTSTRDLGILALGTLAEDSFQQEDVDLLTQVANQIAIAVENALAYREIAELKNKLAEEKLYLEEEIRTEHNFQEAIGESAALKRALSQAETVAPTDSTVLILGETGTGKEMIARATHDLSRRREGTFVKINCAAIPTGLLESELFGHEKGAFTGAIAQKIGRFELAHHGTLFLDEVGDIPLELQPKLLRVLQEREFERLGGTRTLRVDVRVVAATNRNLAQMVEEGLFRRDLYYRLNVFPIMVPPLRERSEDIPLLVRYFVQKYARLMDRRIETISAEEMDALTRYHWPGNVRELENLIERAVILSPGPELRLPVAELEQHSEIPSNLTLQAAEREHILRVLHETNWVVGGPHGAATRLAMKRTTLQSKMRKLGISPRDL
ncbi:MAG: sigma 54-interacting transcriptional regulator [Terriglobia bacterium]|jgi:formate hydrogenlyase transcriptional activator